MTQASSKQDLWIFSFISTGNRVHVHISRVTQVKWAGNFIIKKSKVSFHICTLTQSSGCIFQLSLHIASTFFRMAHIVRVHSRVSSVKFRSSRTTNVTLSLYPLSLHYYATNGLCRTQFFMGDGKCRSAFSGDGLCRGGLWASWILSADHFCV